MDDAARLRPVPQVRRRAELRRGRVVRLRGQAAVEARSMTPTAPPPPLFRHQQALFDQTRDAPAWAVLFEQGLGKTAPTIRTVEYLYREDRIDGAIVVAPNGVHRNWVSDELPVHSGLPWHGLDWHS